jgi:hypothetical protein
MNFEEKLKRGSLIDLLNCFRRGRSQIFNFAYGIPILANLNRPIRYSIFSTMKEVIWDIAHVAHVEILTPKLDESTRFFTDIMWMSITATRDDSIYLRAYDDYEHHTLKLTGNKESGMRHFAWRARSKQCLANRVAAIKSTGLGIGWNDGDLGHGPAYEF